MNDKQWQSSLSSTCSSGESQEPQGQVDALYGHTEVSGQEEVQVRRLLAVFKATCYHNMKVCVHPGRSAFPCRVGETHTHSKKAHQKLKSPPANR